MFANVVILVKLYFHRYFDEINSFYNLYKGDLTVYIGTSNIYLSNQKADLIITDITSLNEGFVTIFFVYSLEMDKIKFQYILSCQNNKRKQ